MGPMGVKRIVDLVSPLIIGNPKDLQDKRKQIFKEPPQITIGNFFSRDKVINNLGDLGGWITSPRNGL